MINKFELFLTYLHAICISPSLVYPSPFDVFPLSMGSMQARTNSFLHKANQFLLKRFGTSVFPFMILEEATSDQIFWNWKLRWGNISNDDYEDASKK